jgi:hypothetical protein
VQACKKRTRLLFVTLTPGTEGRDAPQILAQLGLGQRREHRPDHILEHWRRERRHALGVHADLGAEQSLRRVGAVRVDRVLGRKEVEGGGAHGEGEQDRDAQKHGGLRVSKLGNRESQLAEAQLAQRAVHALSSYIVGAVVLRRDHRVSCGQARGTC